MSRGPGAFQLRILETLALYKRVGPSLGWEWRTGAPYRLSEYADPDDIEGWRREPSVPVWILRRDTGSDRPAMSRALGSLYRRGFVRLYTGALDPAKVRNWSEGYAAKFAEITTEGDAWLKRQQSHTHKVGA